MAKKPDSKPIPPPAAATLPARPIKVRALQLGFYGDVRRRVGDVFIIKNEQAFSSRWMQKVHPNTPEIYTPLTVAMAEKNEQLLRARGMRPSVGEETVLSPDGDEGAGDDNPIGD